MKTLLSFALASMLMLISSCKFVPIKGGPSAETINLSITSNPQFTNDLSFFDPNAFVSGVRNMSNQSLRVSHTDLNNLTVTVDIAPNATAQNFNQQKVAGRWTALPSGYPTPETVTISIGWTVR